MGKQGKTTKAIAKKYDLIAQYNKLFLKITEEFIHRYFTYAPDDVCDWDIIGHALPMAWDVIMIGDDTYFNLAEMVTALMNNVSKENLMKWYNSADDKGYRSVNLANISRIEN